jgi:hypothetical protein
LLPHPDFELGNERPRSFTAHGKPLLRGFAVDAALDLEEHVDTTHGFAGYRRLSLFHQVDKLPPAVAPAGRLKDRRRLPCSLVELVISIKGIGLHNAHIAGKMFSRMFPGTTARVMERCRGWVRTAKRAVIADIGPDPADNSFQFRQHRHRRVVGMDALGAQHMRPDRLDQRIERYHAGPDPIRQGRDIDLDSLASKGLALPVQRLMQQELVDQHHRQQARPGEATRDRMGGCRRLGNCLAVPTRELLADVLDDLPAPRFAFKGLRYHLAKLVQPLAATFAAGARRRLDYTLHRKMLWQRPAARPGIVGALFLSGCRRRYLGLRFLLGLGLFKVLNGELKLLDQQPAAFRGLPVLLAPRLGQHQLQPLDFQAANRHFALRQRQQFALRQDHRMRGGKVGRKRIGGARHTDESIIFVAKNPPRSSSSANKYQLIRKPVDARSPAASANRCRTEGKTIAQR